MWVNNKYDGVGKLDFAQGSQHPGSFTVMADVGGKPKIVHGQSFIGHFVSGNTHTHMHTTTHNYTHTHTHTHTQGTLCKAKNICMLHTYIRMYVVYIYI